jgi:hypothetical protein
MAVVLPRVLGYVGDPSRRLTVLVGANPLSVAIAKALQDAGRKVVVVDSVRSKLRALRRQDLLTTEGDARDAATYEKAGVERDTQVVALTTNDELNLLVAELVREEFGVEHPVVALQQPSEEMGSKRRAWIDLLGGRGLDLQRWNRWLEGDKALLVNVDLSAEAAHLTVAEMLQDGEEEGVVFVCSWSGEQPSFHLDGSIDAAALGKLGEVTLLALRGTAGDALQRFTEEAVEETPGAWEGPLPRDGEGEEAAAEARLAATREAPRDDEPAAGGDS